MAIACLAKLSPMNTATGTRTDIYLSSVGDPVNGPLCNGLNGVVWEPALLRAPSFTVNLWNGDFVAPASPGAASIGIAMEALKKTYAIDGHYWPGTPVTIYAEAPGTAWPWTVRFAGTVTSFNREDQTLTLRAEVDESGLKKNILTATYAGTGGAEGGADIKNRLKPLILGWAMNVEPVLIDATNSVYQFSSYGAIEEVTKLYERGSDFGAAEADYANYTALVAATITPGRWATCLASGMIRLGAPAYGVITGDVKGHKVGANTPRLSGAVISALATIAGVSSGLIETSTLTALDSAAAYNTNHVITEQETWLERAEKMVLACNRMPIIGLTGKFMVNSVSLGGSEVLTVNAQGRALPQVKTSAEQDVSPPYFKTVIGANQCHRVHTLDEISYYAPVIDRGRYDAAAFYREGNIVDLDDGSRWIYINPVPGSGNAPPTWPAASNLYWENLSPPITGLNNVLVYLYKRAASSPSVPSTTSTFTFATGVLTGHDNGWTQAIPATDGNPLYVTVATANGSGATDTIATGEWASPVIMTQDGASGINAATVFLYQRTATNSAPSLPSTTTTYTFATGVATGFDNGWTQTIPSSSGGGFLWVTTGTALGTGSTDTIANTEWAAANLLAQDGQNSAQVYLYQRAASTPSAPTGTFTYTFATGVLSGGTLGSWTQAVPAADGNPLYVIVASAISNSATDTIAAAEFSSPVIDSGAGLSVATVRLYQRAASTPSVPGSTLTYTFSTGVLSGTLGSWTQSVPSGTNPIYTIQATAVSTGTTDTIATGEWSSPVVMAQNGSNGSNGTNGTNGANGTRTAILYMYKWSSTTPTTWPSGSVTYTWATAQFTDPGTLNGWSRTIGTPSAGDKLWRITQTYSDTGTSSTSSVTWSGSYTPEQYTPTLGDLAALNAINTIHINANQVTNLTSAFTGSAATATSTTWVTMQTVTFTSTGAENLITFSGYATAPTPDPSLGGTAFNMRLTRNGTTIWTGTVPYYALQNISWFAGITFIDTPSAGSVTYNLDAQTTGAGGTVSFNDRSLSVLETKR